MSLTVVDGGMLSATNAQYTGFKNRIINGAMVIDQRNNGASVTPTDAQYVVDRWQVRCSQASKLTAQQNQGAVTPPVGFTKYFGVTVGAAANVTLGAGDYFGIQYRIEGFNFADIGMGTANAKTVTVSFWVRSSLTGTFGCSMFDGNATVSYGGSYTITSANTWQFATVTIPGTALGTWNTTNNIGAFLNFSLGAGSSSLGGSANTWNTGIYYQQSGATNLITTNSASLYITGVQVEVGSTATAFDYRPVGTELQLCQRYCVVLGGDSSEFSGYAYTTNNSVISMPFPVTVRSLPTGITTSGQWIGYNATNTSSNATLTFNVGGYNQCVVIAAFTATSGTPSRISANSGVAKIIFNGMEL